MTFAVTLFFKHPFRMPSVSSFPLGVFVSANRIMFPPPYLQRQPFPSHPGHHVLFYPPAPGYARASMYAFQVIIAGNPAAAETRALVSAAQRSFCPNLVLIVEDDATRNTIGEDGGGHDDGGGSRPQEEQDAGGVVGQEPLFGDVLEAYGGGYAPGEGGRAAAYVCFDNACSRPVHTMAELEELL